MFCATGSSTSKSSRCCSTRECPDEACLEGAVEAGELETAKVLLEAGAPLDEARAPSWLCRSGRDDTRILRPPKEPTNDVPSALYTAT
jgi:hypothetical protein